MNETTRPPLSAGPGGSTTLTLFSRAAAGQEARSCDLELSPEFLARYRVGNMLGAGAMGAVYAGSQLSTGRDVAIKFLLASEDPEVLARFRLEGQLLARLAHPAVVKVYDVGDAGGHRYLVTDLLTGGTLRDRLDREQSMPVPAAVALTCRLLEGLAECHRAGIVHRDLKPENVMFDASGEPIIVDLGIGRLSADETRVTRTGALLGTPQYMSPEQWKSEEAGPQADLYSIGVMLFEMIAGRRPFEGKSLLELLDLHCVATPPRLDEIMTVPRAVADAVAKSLEKDPGARHATAEQMIAALRGAAERDAAERGAAERGAAGRRVASRAASPDAERKVSRGTPARVSSPDRKGGPVALRFAALVAVLAVAALAGRAVLVERPPAAPRVVARPVAADPSAMSGPAATSSPRDGLVLDRVRPLPAHALFRLGDGWLRHDGVNCLALSEDGSRLATVDEAGGVAVWDLAARKLLPRIENKQKVAGISFVHGGASLALVTRRDRDLQVYVSGDLLRDPSVTVWDVASGRKLREHGRDMYTACLGGRFAAWREDGGGQHTVGLLDIETGARRNLTVPIEAKRLALSPDGRRLVVFGWTHAVLIDTASTAELGRMKLGDLPGYDDGLGAVAPRSHMFVSPHGSALCVVGRDGLTVVSLPDFQRVLVAPRKYLQSVAFTPDGKHLLVSGPRMENDDVAARASGSGPGFSVSYITGVAAISGDGRKIALAEYWGRISVQEFAGMAIQPLRLEPVGEEVNSVGARAGLIVTRSRTGSRLYRLDGPGGAPAAPVPLGEEEGVIANVSISPDERSIARLALATKSRPMTLSLVDGEGRSRVSWTPPDAVYIQISADGRSVATIDGKHVRIYRPDGIAAFAIPGALPSYLQTLDPTLTWIGAFRQDAPALLRVDSLTEKTTSSPGDSTAGFHEVLAFSPDGRLALARGEDYDSIAVRTVPDMRIAVTLDDVPPGLMYGAAFSADGSLVAGAFPGSIRCWTVAGKTSHVFECPGETPRQLALDVAKDRLVSVNMCGTAIAWKLSGGRVEGQPEGEPRARR